VIMGDDHGVMIWIVNRTCYADRAISSGVYGGEQIQTLSGCPDSPLRVAALELTGSRLGVGVGRMNN
jgi:hypothetical protein